MCHCGGLNLVRFVFCNEQKYPSPNFHLCDYNGLPAANYIENYLALIYFGLFCLVAYYVYILIAGPELVSVSYRHKDFFIPTKQAVLFHVVSQKFVIYGLNFSILWQLIEFKKQKYIDLIE